MTHPDPTPLSVPPPGTPPAVPAGTTTPSTAVPEITAPGDPVPGQPPSAPVEAQPTKENAALLVHLMLGLTALLLLFDGVLIVARPDLDPMVLTKITVVLALVVNVVILSLFTGSKGSAKRLYKLRKAISVLADPDSQEGKS